MVCVRIAWYVYERLVVPGRSGEHRVADGYLPRLTSWKGALHALENSYFTFTSVLDSHFVSFGWLFSGADACTSAVVSLYLLSSQCSQVSLGVGVLCPRPWGYGTSVLFKGRPLQSHGLWFGFTHTHTHAHTRYSLHLHIQCAEYIYIGSKSLKLYSSCSNNCQLFLSKSSRVAH